MTKNYRARARNSAKSREGLQELIVTPNLFAFLPANENHEREHH
jgi:hypothetical protein